jgi:simple sugar transport system substrate-binding protein
MSRFAPNAQLTAIVDNWGPYYVERIKAVQAGTWQSHNIWHGLKEGMVEIAPYGPAVPADVAAEADRIKDAIIAGELHPFTGPIHNQAGELVLPEGQTMADEDILRMNYYVQGIEGSLPT